MKINYYHNGETTIGVATYDDEISLVSGVDLWLCMFVHDRCNSAERRQLCNSNKLIAYAKPHGGDKYNKEIGERIVRDKLLVKHAERLALKQSIIDKHILQFQKELKGMCMKNVARMNSAYERLEQYQ